MLITRVFFCNRISVIVIVAVVDFAAILHKQIVASVHCADTMCELLMASDPGMMKDGNEDGDGVNIGQCVIRQTEYC